MSAWNGGSRMHGARQLSFFIQSTIFGHVGNWRQTAGFRQLSPRACPSVPWVRTVLQSEFVAKLRHAPAAVPMVNTKGISRRRRASATGIDLLPSWYGPSQCLVRGQIARTAQPSTDHQIRPGTVPTDGKRSADVSQPPQRSHVLLPTGAQLA